MRRRLGRVNADKEPQGQGQSSRTEFTVVLKKRYLLSKHMYKKAEIEILSKHEKKILIKISINVC